MTLDASGRLLVGGTASQGNGSRLQISGNTQYFGSQSANGLLSSTSYFNTNSTGFEIAKLDVSTGANIYEGVFQFYTKDSGGTMAERARITSGGDLLVGTTTNKVTQFGGDANGVTIGGAAYPVLALWDTANSSYNLMLAQNGGTGYVINYANGPLVFGTNNNECARFTAGGQFLVGTTSDVTVSAPVGATVGVQNLGGTIICSVTGISFSSPYTQNVVIDIAWNNWGANNVIGLVDLIAVLREWAHTGGTAFGKVFATNTSSAATFSTFNTTDVTVSQCTIAAASGGNYTLKITIDPSNTTDRASVYMVIPGTGGTSTAVSSITVSVV
jgi:hypothetical protein